MRRTVEEILRGTRLEVSPETFTLISVSKEAWPALMANEDLSPRGSAPFMVFSDRFEVTLLVDEIDFQRLQPGVADAGVEGGFRLLTFDTLLDFTVVGFMADVTSVLADAGISIIALSAFSHDHLLVKQKDLAAALKALGPFVEELC